jgi:Heterokaryon incompatibility protein (HET)
MQSSRCLSDYQIDDAAASDNTESQISWRLITKWIDDCLRDHSQCSAGRNRSWKPTRLVDLGEDASKLQPRLIISNDHFTKTSNGDEPYPDNSSDHYVTLSHCWGRIEILRLLRGELETLRKSIPLESLPKTFRHAMRVTRDLGVRYFWVDSLCIIQDSPSDWLQEAANMSHVYKNSFCNIAATGAADGNQGCFFSRNPNTISATKIQPKWDDALSESYLVAQPLVHFQSNFLGSPLLSRAWVLQERLLAPRTLHFTKEQVFWECRTHMACEMYPNGIKTAPSCGGHHASVGLNDLYIHRKQDADEEANRGLPKAAIEWNRIVDLYTMCDLTQASDKLIALSGIASDFHNTRLRPDDEYLAGLWKSQMPNALLWQAAARTRHGTTLTLSRPINYRAPSWSWASLEGSISMRATEQIPGHWYHVFTEVLGAETQLFGGNPTGQVTGGVLHLLVLFATAKWKRRDKDMWLAESWKPDGERFKTYSYSTSQFWCRLIFDVETECEDVITTPIVCMQYSAPIEGTTHDHILTPILHGFVLEDTGVGSFRRLGLWVASTSGGVDQCKVPEFLKYFSVRMISLV